MGHCVDHLDEGKTDPAWIANLNISALESVYWIAIYMRAAGAPILACLSMAAWGRKLHAVGGRAWRAEKSDRILTRISYSVVGATTCWPTPTCTFG